jgi:hypothetical protein
LLGPARCVPRETLADPRMLETVAANAGDLQVGGVRLLIIGARWRHLLAAGGGRIFGGVAAGTQPGDGSRRLVSTASSSTRPQVSSADDDLVRAMRAAPAPARVLDPGRAGLQPRDPRI